MDVLRDDTQKEKPSLVAGLHGAGFSGGFLPGAVAGGSAGDDSVGDGI